MRGFVMRRNVKRSNVVTIEIGSSELVDSPQMGCMPHGLPAWRVVLTGERWVNFWASRLTLSPFSHA